MAVRQAYTLINALYAQATGRTDIAAVDAATYTSIASKLSAMEDNQILKALSNVMSGIEVSVRPYEGHFRLMWNSESEYGAFRMKVTFLDNADATENAAYALADGQILGQHIVKLPRSIELAIKDSDTISVSITIARKQVKEAFPSPDALEQFFSGLMVQIKNELEIKKDAVASALLANYIATKSIYHAKATAQTPDPKYAGNHIVNLRTEFNSVYGTTYATVKAIRTAGKYPEFIAFCFSQVAKYARKMRIASVDFHMNPVDLTNNSGVAIGGTVTRHTPTKDLRMMVLADYLEDIPFMVKTNLYNEEYLKLIPHEEINFWQSYDTPEDVKLSKVKSLAPDGTELLTTTTTTVSNVFAVLYDTKSLGIGIMDEHTGDTPYDENKEALNRYFKLHYQTWNDFTENGVVFTMN